jgi:hypothetical protein
MVYTSKQKRRITPQIKREIHRRAAVEPVIGHPKNECRMEPPSAVLVRPPRLVVFGADVTVFRRGYRRWPITLRQ